MVCFPSRDFSASGSTRVMPAPDAALSDELTRNLAAAVAALKAAQKSAARTYGIQMPVEPEIIRIRRFIQFAKKGDVARLSRRPASAKKLRAAQANAKKAKGATSEDKKKSSRRNLERWRDKVYWQS